VRQLIDEYADLKFLLLKSSDANKDVNTTYLSPSGEEVDVIWHLQHLLDTRNYVATGESLARVPYTIHHNLARWRRQ
jgi:hypothetical protein